MLASSNKLKDRLSPSISVPVRLITTLWSSDVVALVALATGASFTANTVTVNVCDDDSSPSVAVTVNYSLPL